MSSTVLELDEVFRRHAWNILQKKSNFLRRMFLDETDYTASVDWSALSLEHKLYKFSSKYTDDTLIETNWGKVLTGSKWVTLWSCDFDNKADSKQTHAFRGSRDTTTWVDVDLDQCYTINKQVCIQVNIPPNLSKYCAGRDNSLSLNKVKGQVFKEILTWEVNSQVELLPSRRAHCKLEAKEECSAIEFEIRTTLLNIKGKIPVSFLRKSDKSVAHVVNIENLEEVFLLEEDGGALKPEEKPCVQVRIEKTVDATGQEKLASFPQLVTKGSCVCLSWSDQKVDIATSSMSIDRSENDGDVDSINKPVGQLVSEKEFKLITGQSP